VRHELFAPTNSLSNMADNVLEWTSSLWGKSLAKPDFG
jgi:formylglycine-generating enzyme required for sulfatase activity